DLWAEVYVGGISLGRSKLGAVPYAVEAARASDATGALKTALNTIDSSGVKLTGDQTIAGTKTFSNNVNVSATARFGVGVYVNVDHSVVDVQCNAGDTAISGGGTCGPGDTLFLESYPIPTDAGPPTGWHLNCENHNFGFSGTPTDIYVVCLSHA